MRHVLALVGSALYAAALLFVVASIAAAMTGLQPFAAGSWRDWWREPVVWCLGLVVTTEMVRLSRGTGQSAQRLIAGARRIGKVMHPRRGVLGRWYHLSFHEPLTDSEQARVALFKLCGYRLQASDYRIESIRPALRRGRLGAWVTVAQTSKSTRRWACCFVRWIDDPNELWLLRSALRPSPESARTPPPASPRGANDLERMTVAELDQLLQEPSEV
jgi:hypothetical protein